MFEIKIPGSEQPIETDDYVHAFDANKYLAHNYEQVLPEDRFFIETITHTSLIAELGVEPKMFHTVMDAGNGGSMIAPGLMAPFIQDDGRLLLSDIGYPQLHVIGKTIRKGRRGHLGIWQKYEDMMAHNELWQNAITRACSLAQESHQSVYNFAPNSYDAGMMCYVAESISSTRRDFERVSTAFYDAIRSGGLVIWTAMLGSQGYDTPGSPFKAYWVDHQDMIDIAEDHLKNIRSFFIEASQGIRRKGGPCYSGTGLVVGLKR